MLECFGDFLSREHVYQPEQIEEVIKEVRHYFRFNRSGTRQKYFNVPCSFDIETSSFYDDHGEKVGLMYAWTFGIYGLVIMGRTWKQFVDMCEKIVKILELNEDKRLMVFVHNLQFDFQFFRSHFDFIQVFAVDRRKPLYALTSGGIEFRCSYLLSGYSLETCGKNLLKYTVKKQVGDLNYNLIRHAETPLTALEVGYCVADAKVVMAYIAEEIERCEGIGKLPYTKTGYVRRYCRDSCFIEPDKPRKKSKKRLNYRQIMERLILSADLYRTLKRAFAGGFTHGNAINTKRVLYNVSSYDFTSSYPAVMVSEKFPMGKPEKVDCSQLSKDRFYDLLKCYSSIFTITFSNIREKTDVFENYISSSKCQKLENPIINNGRIVRADVLTTTICEVDFQLIQAMYEWDSFHVSGLWIWSRDYLPRDFVLSILELYKNKTELKGVEGKEQEYQISKGMLNATFGCCVTDIVREVNAYTDHWITPYIPDVETEIEKYNKDWRRFLYYPWGIYITAYARRNLFTGILNAGIDYIYADTDSIKLVNADAHADYFQRYNKVITQKIEKCLTALNIPLDYMQPETIKGIKKLIGVWDYEGCYTRFKTLGAKRYMLEKDGKIEMTVSGLNKRVTVPWLQKKYKTNDAIFAAFDDGLRVPAEYTGKRTHIYIDEERRGSVTDYRGTSFEYIEKTGIHLEPSPYELSITGLFKDYLIQKMKGL